MTGRNVVLQAHSISKSFAGRSVLRMFNFEVAAGEVVALTGASGSGKSTLLNIAGLLESPDAGHISLHGVPAPPPRSKDAVMLRRKVLGYLFQNFALIDEATVEENMKVALAYAPGRKHHAKLIAAALEKVGLPGSAKRPVYTLSGGEQQRVAIARLLLKPCDIVFADEPTGSLDVENAVMVQDLLHVLAQEGKAVLIATHDAEVVKRSVRAISLVEHLADPGRQASVG